MLVTPETGTGCIDGGIPGRLGRRHKVGELKLVLDAFCTGRNSESKLYTSLCLPTSMYRVIAKSSDIRGELKDNMT